MYIVELSKTSKRFLKTIQTQDREIILNKIYSLKENPFRFLKRLKGYKLWRLRVLKYRIIVDVVVSGNRIVVLRISYRKNIY